MIYRNKYHIILPLSHGPGRDDPGENLGHRDHPSENFARSGGNRPKRDAIPVSGEFLESTRMALGSSQWLDNPFR